jgi:F-type H+-transporting ATPase subunit gamma
MAQLREIRRRIRSIQKTKQVTRAMKMVAAAKLRRAQEAIIHARPYANKLQQVIEDLLLSQSLPPHPLLEKKPGNRLHLVVLAGDRGLCGSFNTTVFREVESLREKFQNEIELTILGKKGFEYFSRRRYTIIQSEAMPDRKKAAALANQVSQNITGRFISGECSLAGITYMEYKSAMSQKVVTDWLLPLEFKVTPSSEINLDFIFYPDAEKILKQVLPRYLHSQVYRAMLESQASEFGARMTAMDMATRNSDEMISSLTLVYNQARQAAITREIIEVVSGAEALAG